MSKPENWNTQWAELTRRRVWYYGLLLGWLPYFAVVLFFLTEVFGLKDKRNVPPALGFVIPYWIANIVSYFRLMYWSCSRCNKAFNVWFTFHGNRSTCGNCALKSFSKENA